MFLEHICLRVCVHEAICRAVCMSSRVLLCAYELLIYKLPGFGELLRASLSSYYILNKIPWPIWGYSLKE